jgi:hypothetical protein
MLIPKWTNDDKHEGNRVERNREKDKRKMSLFLPYSLVVIVTKLLEERLRIFVSIRG